LESFDFSKRFGVVVVSFSLSGWLEMVSFEVWDKMSSSSSSKFVRRLPPVSLSLSLSLSTLYSSEFLVADRLVSDKPAALNFTIAGGTVVVVPRS